MTSLKTGRKVVFGLAALLSLVGLALLSIHSRRTPVIPVQIEPVHKRDRLAARVTASGEINPREYVELQSEVPGVIMRLHVHEGEAVKKGDLLLLIDPTQTEAEMQAQLALVDSAVAEAENQKAQISIQEAQRRRDQASLQVSEIEVVRAEENLALMRRNFQRKSGLFEERLLSRELYEEAKNELAASDAALLSARARLEQARAQVALADTLLEQARNSYTAALSRVRQHRATLSRSQDSHSKTIIRSPLTGMITRLNVEVGERAVPGTLNNPAATLMEIADLSVIEAEVEVDETDIINIRMGQSAVVLVDALPDQPLKGWVTEIGNAAIARPGQAQEAKDFKVSIRLDHPPSALRPGLSCTAQIETAVRHNVIAIPLSSMTERELPARQNPASPPSPAIPSVRTPAVPGVFLLEQGKARFVPVKTGIVGETEIEILSGLHEGEPLISGSYQVLRTLKDGDSVRAEKPRGL
ncbi:MAG: efflux RND transporter periplasmic adaptor subunit [Acidobacteria bacterium]|nr:efflux RND transporter periplasmic adaptor subunit [Acidobacteriota bacterium]